jgi:hypothetical protein
MRIWCIRLFRFWLVVLLPLSGYFLYQAYSANTDAIECEHRANGWRLLEEQHNKQFPNNPYRTMSGTTVLEERENTMDLHREFIEDRGTYSVWAIITFTLPILLIIIFYAIRWIWFTTVPKNDNA